MNDLELKDRFGVLVEVKFAVVFEKVAEFEVVLRLRVRLGSVRALEEILKSEVASEEAMKFEVVLVSEEVVKYGMVLVSQGVARFGMVPVFVEVRKCGMVLLFE